MSIFAEQLKQAIEESGISIAALSAMSGLSASLLYKYQSGTRLPDSLETLERLLDLIACPLARKRDLLQLYRSERIGDIRFVCFQEMKDMLADMANCITVPPDGAAPVGGEIPSVVTGGSNVNMAVRLVMERESAREDGFIDMLIPVKYSFCMELLSQVSQSCHPKFRGVRHLFSLQATVTDVALLDNMRTIRQMLPKLMTLERYDPRYCYTPDTDNGAIPFPYMMVTSSGVLLLSGDRQSAVYLRDPEIVRLYQQMFRQMLPRYTPVMQQSEASLQSYAALFRSIMDDVGQSVHPVLLGATPCVLPCISFETIQRIAPAEELKWNYHEAYDLFLDITSKCSYTTFFTKEGFCSFLETGVFHDVPGARLSPLTREDRIMTVKRMLQQARDGHIKPYLFRMDIFRGTSCITLALYGTKLLTICEMPRRDNLFLDVREATLSHILRGYIDNVQLLGDVYPVSETIEILEAELQKYLDCP